MVTEIVPKPKTKAVRISLGDAFYYLVIFALFASFLGYFACDYFQKKSQTQLEVLKTTIFERQSKKINLLEEKVLGAKEKIETFANLFDSYQKSTRLFELIGLVCHPQIFFFETRVEVENAKVILWGHADSFKSVREQILILENEPKIESLNLSQIKIAEEGGIDFEVSLSFKPEILREP